ncbi:Sn1-specific diacylglycerol lipase alpha [Fasciola gigantica]|uniref:Sn1-specific diacylglycerol lipase alpha n=1 Tax=Fasciola gigantica TaxID=46835 RepID=A0A504YG01_FASGI|nr:Sn1-specific diacylglycerol lipase alpha [Fasciola gigantica]
MPAIIFLRRSWSFASDEFVLPAIFDVIMRTICMLLMGIPFCVVKDVPQCLPSTVSKVFFVAVFIVVFIFMVIEIFLAVLSSKGGVMQIHKRSGVPDLLLTLLVLSIIELAVHIANIYFATRFRSPCTRTVSLLCLSHHLTRLIRKYEYTRWTGSRPTRVGKDWLRLLGEERTTHQGFLAHDANLNTKLQAYELLHQSVRRRLQRLNSMKTSRTRRNRAETEEQHAISSAAALFSEVFYDVDLVASDIMAGLLLLRWQSNQWVGCGHRVPYHLIERDSVPCEVYGGGDSVPISEKHTVDQQPNASVFGDVRSSRSSNEDVSWLNMSRLQRVCQMGISIYGKLFFCCLFRGKPNATCRLCRHLTCDCRKKPGASSQDAHIGCCLCTNHNCDLAAVMEMGSIELDHFVTITFENTLYHSPYFVAHVTDRFPKL